MYKNAFNRPVVESFLDSVLRSSVWPETLLGDGRFVEQTDDRRELSMCFDSVIDLMPMDISIDEAVDGGSVPVESAERLLCGLSRLLEGGKDYRRIVLYLPFEILPHGSWVSSDKGLDSACERFRSAYMKAWNELLFVHDVRANFVDGDVLEVEQRCGDLPRVVKAAHLAPKLFERGWLTVEELKAIIDDDPDPLLKKDLSDALEVIYSMPGASGDGKPCLEAIDFESVEDSLLRSLQDVEGRDFGAITNKRRRWLIDSTKDAAINGLGDKIAAAIVAGIFDARDAESFLSASASVMAKEVLVDGIGKAVLAVDESLRQETHRHFKTIVSRLWSMAEVPVIKRLKKALYHWKSRGIVDGQELEGFGMVMPKFCGRLSDNLLLAHRRELDFISLLAVSSSNNNDLSSFIYPVVLVYGSRLKGYGEADADFDIAVFIRPGVPFDHRERLRDAIADNFLHSPVGGEVVEFWLEDDGDRLRVRDFEEVEPTLGGSHWTNVLLAAVWEGEEASIRELRHRLIPSYMSKTDKVIAGRAARGRYLEEMERDTLLYRLLHKGYERFFPSSVAIAPPLADKIDGRSPFYDPGYRRLATKLFIDRVFLPVI